jgi:hypothetical protein
MVFFGIFAFVGGLLTASTWSSIHRPEGMRRRHHRRRSDRPYAL